MVKKTGALIDFGFREKIKVTGKDRVSFLHRMLTNDIQNLPAGKGCFACLLTPQAKVIADMLVYVFPEYIVLDTMPGLSNKIINALSKFVIMDDVKLEDITKQLCDFVILGPNAETFIHSLTNGSHPKENLANQETKIKTLDVQIIYLDLFGTKAWAILSDKKNEQALRSLLETSGLNFIGMETIEILRVESGMPFFGVDFNEEIIVLEAGLDHTISFTKGCYPGQEIVARMDSRAKFAKKLTQIAIHGDQVPKSGDKITKNGKEIGKVTSAVYSPKLGQPLALGFIARDFLTPKNEVEIGTQKGYVLIELKS